MVQPLPGGGVIRHHPGRHHRPGLHPAADSQHRISGNPSPHHHLFRPDAEEPTLGLVLWGLLGLAQDSLSHLPLGMYGIAKTLVGYFAASVSLRFDVENIVVRFTLTFFFFFFHQFFYWIMRRALLGQDVPLDAQRILLQAMLNSIVAVPLYLILDRMRLSRA